ITLACWSTLRALCPSTSMVTASTTLPAAWWWYAGSRRQPRNSSRWRGATSISWPGRRRLTAGSATASATTAAGMTSQAPRIAGAAPCGALAPPLPGPTPWKSVTATVDVDVSGHVAYPYVAGVVANHQPGITRHQDLVFNRYAAPVVRH